MKSPVIFEETGAHLHFNGGITSSHRRGFERTKRARVLL